MDLKDVASLVYFRELNFLPRVIFFIGAILLIGSFFIKSFLLGLLGVGVILAGSTLNLVTETALGFYAHCKDKKTGKIPLALLLQAILAFGLTFATLWLLYHFYRHGEMPTFLRPLSNELPGTR